MRPRSPLRMSLVSLVLLGSVARGPVARAETADVADQPSSELGERVSGPYDVSFRPFADAKPTGRAETAGEIARLGRDDKHWLLVFDRAELPEALPMKDFRNDAGVLTAGYLSASVNKLRADDAKADVLRNEVIDLGDLRIGVLAAVTHDKAGKVVLLQQAMMEVTPKLHYDLVMSCPIETDDAAKSPAAREAAGVFKLILDSIVRVDLTTMKQDQDERLYRARGLFAIWNRQKLLGKLVPERYLRFKREGKDVGYAYVVEQPADALPKSGEIQKNQSGDAATATGFRVGVRTHTVADGGRAADVESWQYVTFDRRHEVWSSVTVLSDPLAKNDKDKASWFSEVGSSDMQRERQFIRNLRHDDFKDYDQASRTKPEQQPFTEVDKYRLNVRSEGRSAVADPIQRDLPVFYLPQALTTLLPRLVPVDHPAGYLFASYNPDNRNIMLRYVDVQAEREVRLDGRTLRAVPVVEKIGFAGPPTTHYLSPKGEFLASINDAARVEAYPSDHDTLAAVWKDANLSEPAAVK